MIIEKGYYTLTPYQNLLYIESYSSWDDRAVTEYINDLVGLVIRYYQDKPWAILCDGTNWKISTPKAEQMLTAFISNEAIETITHHAIVTGPTELNKWQADNIIKDVTTYTCKNFEYIGDAIEWLKQAGYDMANPA